MLRTEDFFEFKALADYYRFHVDEPLEPLLDMYHKLVKKSRSGLKKHAPQVSDENVGKETHEALIHITWYYWETLDYRCIQPKLSSVSPVYYIGDSYRPKCNYTKKARYSDDFVYGLFASIERAGRTICNYRLAKIMGKRSGFLISQERFHKLLDRYKSMRNSI